MSEGHGSGIKSEGREASVTASRVEAQNQGKPLLDGITGPRADDGSLMMAQQAKAVEEEDAQTTPGGLY